MQIIGKSKQQPDKTNRTPCMQNMCDLCFWKAYKIRAHCNGNSHYTQHKAFRHIQNNQAIQSTATATAIMFAASRQFQMCMLLAVALFHNSHIETMAQGVGGGGLLGGLLGGNGNQGGKETGLVSQLAGGGPNNTVIGLVEQLVQQLVGIPTGSAPCCGCCNGTFGVNAVCATIGNCPHGIIACTAQPCQVGQQCLIDAGNLLCVGV